MDNQNIVPKLRFPGFSDNWYSKRFGDLYTFKSTNSLSRDNLNYENGEAKNIHYGDIHTKFNAQFDISKEPVPFINANIDLSKISKENYLQQGDLVIADASEDYADIGKSIEITNLNNEKVLAGLHTFLARRKTEELSVRFSAFLMKTNKVRLNLMRIAQGTKVLSISSGRLSDIKLNYPSPNEQSKIASFISAIDKQIQLLEKEKALLEKYKKGIVQKIFNREIRFKDENGDDFTDWEEKKLGDILDYEQPTKYLVTDTDYSNEYSIPVLTAGKTFLLGYTNETEGVFNEKLPTIIFDDFTTAFQFVDFPFKAKSSAMKMLIPKEKVNLKFVFEAMKTIKFPIAEHKRYWISEYQLEIIPFPSPEEQTKIASFLIDIDNLIQKTDIQLIESIQFKTALLQKLFV